MANAHGDFIWYELQTPDPDAAKAFYDAVVGWTIEAEPAGEMDYRMVTAADGNVGGVLRLTPEMTAGGARPAWIGYLGVDDVDAAAAAVTGGGGAVHMPPTTLEGVGRMAMVADPEGAPFYVMRGASDDTSMAFAWDRPRLGHCAWNELAVADPAAAKAFYLDRFGWTKDGEMEMGEMGTYEFLRSASGVFGGLMPRMPGMPVSDWTYYFCVPDIDVAAAAVPANGGAVVQAPMEIPGGDYALVATDPHGAAFGLVGERKGGTA